MGGDDGACKIVILDVWACVFDSGYLVVRADGGDDT